MASLMEQPKRDVAVKLKRMASMWRKRNRGGGGSGGGGSSRRNPPSDVPPGHLAVLVGTSSQRFVIKAEHLNHPIFHPLLDQAYEELSHQRNGPLALPCNESRFREVVGSIERRANAHPSSCRDEERRHSASLICGSMRRSVVY
ncbi:hypothetical protein BT93_A1007 [Corymbia citriodora subsp. variegata]|nr:hypothetical protein BT93_A1007 [Corymbia citriodora subsp. variegata]